MSPPLPHRCFRIGLTGGIGSGKTAVSNAFAKYGIPIIDTDLIARDIVEPGEPAYLDLVNTFGASILDDQKQLNRRALRDIVFNSDEARVTLEKITHPRIIERMRAAVDQCEAQYCIICIPLLFETGLEKEVDRVLVVDVPVSTQRDRIMRRDTLSADQADAIIRSQLDRDSRLTGADDIIDNTRSLTELDARVADLHQQYLALSA